MKRFDQELVLEAIQGNKEAISVVVEKYYQRILYTTIQKFGVDKGTEVAHKAVVEIIQSLKNLKDPEKLGVWMMRLVDYVCINEMKSKYRGQEMFTEFEDGDPDSYIESDNMEFIPDEYVINVEKREQVLKALKTLPENYQDALLDFFFYEMSYEEIAAVKNISLTKVRNDLFRGKRLLKKKLEAMEGKSFAYSVGVGTLPILSQLLQADAAVKVTPNMCNAFMSGVKKEISHLTISTISKSSTNVIMKIVFSSIVTAGLAGSAFIAAKPPKEPILEVPIHIETTTQASVVTTDQTVFVINTLEDMIGVGEAKELIRFTKGIVDSDKWSAFLKHINAELEEVATEHESEYTVYLLRKQDKQLLLAEKRINGSDNLAIYYQFGEIDDLPMMIEIILQFDAK